MLENFNCVHFQWLSNFDALKQLSLCFVNNTGILKSVQLNEIFHFCQYTIETIILKEVRITYECSKDMQLPTLKRLDLLKVEICKNTDIFISRSLPNLSYLTLLYYGMMGAYFHFPYFHLYCLGIRHLETEVTEILKVDVPEGQHLFFSKSQFNRHKAPMHVFKYDEQMFPPNELWNRAASDDEPAIIVLCDSVRDVLY